MDYETPAEWITRRIAELDITQKQLAELTGMAPEQISRYARAVKVPEVDRIRRLCAVLGPFCIVAEKRILDLR